MANFEEFPANDSEFAADRAASAATEVVERSPGCTVLEFQSRRSLYR